MSVNSRNARKGPIGRVFLGMTIIFLLAALLAAGCTSQKAVVSTK